jgi:glutathione S-transferase
MTRLITIPFSHYCEKARWALERCDLPFTEDGHLPVFHYLAVRRAGAGRTVPVLVADDKTVVADSTDIVAWADAQRPGALLPGDSRDRDDALALEDDFDRQLGPASRRWAYFHMLPRRDFDHLVLRGTPRWEAAALRLARPLAVRFLKRSLKIDAAGAERSKQKIDETFQRVGELLADARYLVGDRFTVADLTFAALAAPILLPDGHPTEMMPLAAYEPLARATIVGWRESRAGQHALRMYAEHRGERMTIVMKRGA